MSAEIDPLELDFHRPFTTEVSEALKIRNTNTHPIAFKVKTTAPKQYCVRPNSGRVEPGKEVEVQVILQAMKQEPPLDAKCRDKFLVQSVAITSDREFANLGSIWDSVDKSSIQEKKIRVAFLPAGGASAGAGPSQAETPVRQHMVNGHEATPEVAPPPAYSSPSDYAAQAEPKSSPDASRDMNEASTSAAGAGASTGAKASESTYEELKQQLAQAERMITQLKQEQGGLRQRKVAGGDNKPGAQLAQAPARGTEGVPIQITALLCLLSFLLAYLFF